MLTLAFYICCWQQGKGGVDAWMLDGGLCLAEEMSSHVDDPSVRVIRNRAIWTASDWFQYGSTKSDNRSGCQSNQSSELSSQQPIRSILIKLEEEKVRGAPSVLRWHGPAWQCPKWIFCGTSVGVHRGNVSNESCFYLGVSPCYFFFFFFYSILHKPGKLVT